MRVIFYNDDFGLSYGFTEAIKDCYVNGVTTSTCIRTNGTAFGYACELANTSMKKIGMGLHLNITEGPTHLADLANNVGHYKYSYLQYILELKQGNRKLLHSIEKEFEYQFKLARENNLVIDHINSQEHIHMIPPLFDLTCKLAKKHGIKYVRMVNEPFHRTSNSPAINYIKWALLNYFSKYNRIVLDNYKLTSADAFYGLLSTNIMNYDNIIFALTDALKRKYKIIEILSHPVFEDKRDIVYTSKFIETYSTLPSRQAEANALTNPKLISFLKKYNVETVNCES